MPRLSLTTPLQNICFGQFMSLSKEFQAACEESFGANSKAKIRLMNSLPMVSGFIEDDDTYRFMEQYNSEHTTLLTGTLADVTKEKWSKARYAEIVIRPAGDHENDEMGILIFKGARPETASYYLQGGRNDAAVLQKINESHPLMIKGDGYDSHTP